MFGVFFLFLKKKKRLVEGHLDNSLPPLTSEDLHELGDPLLDNVPSSHNWPGTAQHYPMGRTGQGPIGQVRWIVLILYMQMNRHDMSTVKSL